MPQSNREKLKFDTELMGVLVDLRMFVDMKGTAPEIAYRNGIYQTLDPDTVYTKKVDGWEFGYRLIDLGNGFYRRRIFVMCEQKLDTVPDEQKEPVVNTVFEVFLDKGAGEVSIEPISEFTVRIEQDFMPMLLIEKNPNLVSKGPLITPKKETVH